MFSNHQLHVAREGNQISLGRPVHSLSELDVADFVAGLASLKATWTAELFEDCDRDVFLLLAPANADDNTLSFSVDRNLAGLRLTAWRGDVYELLGTFTRTQDALGFIWKLVEAEHSRTSNFDHDTLRRACQIVAPAGIGSSY